MPSEAWLDAGAAPGIPFDRSRPLGYSRAFKSGDVDGSVRVVLEPADEATGR